MQPTHQPGDTLLGWRGPFRARAGQVVVAWHDGLPVIQRIAAVTERGITVHGDNPADSIDSRQFGDVPRAHIEAVILLKLP
jgi:phage repressor protein C with HTH and peptisase S24 domain